MANSEKPRTKKPRTLMAAKITSENNTSLDYHQIVNLVAASCRVIPGDLVVETFLKLPVKSLLRFKSVCKPWKLLINSRVFIDIHLHRKNPQHGVFTLKRFDQQRDEHLERFPYFINHVIGNCNGVICFGIYNKLYSWVDQDLSLVLYNPSIRQFYFLPPEYRGKFTHHQTKGGLRVYGFCYLPKTQEYKVFSFKLNGKNSVDMRVLTLGVETKSFRDVEDIILPGRIDRYKLGATTGTSMFWLGFDEYRKDIVICYDAIEDRFSKMNVPPSSSSSASAILRLDRSLGVLKNSVNMFVHSCGLATSFDIWMLITDDFSTGKSWMKYITVGPLIGPLGKSLVMYPVSGSWYDRLILCCKDDDDDENANEDDDEDSDESKDLFYYDLETNQVVEYTMTDPPIDQFVIYVESLVSMNKIVLSNDIDY